MTTGPNKRVSFPSTRICSTTMSINRCRRRGMDLLAGCGADTPGSVPADEWFRRILSSPVHRRHRAGLPAQNAAGFAIRLEKHIQVRHLKRWTASNFIRTEFLDRALPWARLILDRRQLSWDLNLKRSDVASVLFTYLLVLSDVRRLFPVAMGRPGRSVRRDADVSQRRPVPIFP